MGSSGINTAQFSRTTPLTAPQHVGGARRAACAVRPVRAQAKKNSDDVEPIVEPLTVSRRVLGLSSMLGAASLTTDLVFPSPVEAKKIVSGYSPLEGFDVTYVFHKTGTMGADDWYKNAFKPFLDGGLHSGEVGGPETGAAFKTVFNVSVLPGREAENETVAVAFVHPQASSDAIAKFFDDKNPFWQQGREEGWLLGPITNFKTTPFLVRGPDPKTGYPRSPPPTRISCTTVLASTPPSPPPSTRGPSTTASSRRCRRFTRSRSTSRPSRSTPISKPSSLPSTPSPRSPTISRRRRTRSSRTRFSLSTFPRRERGCVRRSSSCQPPRARVQERTFIIAKKRNSFAK